MTYEGIDRAEWKVILFETEFSRADKGQYLQSLTVEECKRGLGALVAAYGELSTGPVTLILAGEIPDAFGFALHSPEDWESAPTESEALASIRAAGWETPKEFGWMRCSRKGFHDVFVLVHDWADSDDCPLISNHSTVTANQLFAWHERFGIPWRGNGMMTGSAQLREVHRRSVKAAKDNKRKAPGSILWQLKATVPDVEEKPWTARSFRPYGEAPSVALGRFDANKAHLAAALSGLFARGDLAAGPREFDKALSGYWLAEIEPWHDKLFPDPAGPSSAPEGEARWVTTETLALLAELHDKGIHGGFKVRRSLVGHGTQVLRPWAEMLRDALYGAGGHEPGTAAIKATYSRTIGGMALPTSITHRPDWRHTVIARCRAIQWRKMAAVREATGAMPVEIQSDDVAYTVEHSGLVLEAKNRNGKHVFPIGVKLGEFSFTYTEGK